MLQARVELAAAKAKDAQKFLMSKDNIHPLVRRIVLEHAVYSQSALSDFWLWLKNSHIIIALFLAHPKHPFGVRSRLIVLISNLLFGLGLAALLQSPEDEDLRTALEWSVLPILQSLFGFVCDLAARCTCVQDWPRVVKYPCIFIGRYVLCSMWWLGVMICVFGLIVLNDTLSTPFSGHASGRNDDCVACDNSCFFRSYVNNGECDDGGLGSVSSFCDCGTDCADCGPRNMPPPPSLPPPLREADSAILEVVKDWGYGNLLSYLFFSILLSALRFMWCRRAHQKPGSQHSKAIAQWNRMAGNEPDDKPQNGPQLWNTYIGATKSMADLPPLAPLYETGCGSCGCACKPPPSRLYEACYPDANGHTQIEDVDSAEVQLAQVVEVESGTFASVESSASTAAVPEAATKPAPGAAPPSMPNVARPPDAGTSVQVVVPQYVPPDRMLNVALPGGAQVMIQVPPGVLPGQMLHVQL